MGSKTPRPARTVVPSVLPAVDELKRQARRLRSAAAERGTDFTHSDSLELLARQHGQRDWNTLSALASTPPDFPAAPAAPGEPPWRPGQRVAGRYMGHPFTGRLIGLSLMPAPERFRVTVQLDRPVDPVEFDSFSALRHRVSAVLDGRGVSMNKRSDGTRHLVLDVPGAAEPGAPTGAAS